MTVRERLLEKVEVSESGCWLWTRSKHAGGYGVMRIAGKNIGAHRVAYEEFVGPIPPGFDIHHACDNPACVNPAHLEALTHQENCRRGRHRFNGEHLRRRTHCPKGHPYDEINTLVSCGKRRCRECGRQRDRLRRG